MMNHGTGRPPVAPASSSGVLSNFGHMNGLPWAGNQLAPQAAVLLFIAGPTQFALQVITVFHRYAPIVL